MSIISEVSETLALTNEPGQLLETALDTLTELLNTDCCWIQLVSLGSAKLPVVACRGFTPDMRREMASMNLGHRFSNEIIGLGHSIAIPKLSQDGNYGIPVFEKSGFRSLVAVPIMTYRIHGVIGVAYRVRRKFSEDFTQLLAVIANLIGMSLNKSMLYQQLVAKQKQPVISPLESSAQSRDNQNTAVKPEDVADTGPRHQSETKKSSGDFQKHIYRMRVFHSSHQT